MSNEIISRSVELDTVEFEGGEGRTLHARLFRWDVSSQVSDGGPSYPEVWERGVFAQSIKRAQKTGRGWPLMYNHDVRSVPIGIVPMIHERSDGPWMTAKISRTSTGDDMIELIKDGAIPGVSVNGRNIRSSRDRNGTIRRMEVALGEISVTPFPSLVGADEMVLRHGSGVLLADLMDIEETPPPVKRDELAEYLASLQPPS